MYDNTDVSWLSYFNNKNPSTTISFDFLIYLQCECVGVSMGIF